MQVGAIRSGRAHTCVTLLDGARGDPNAHGRLQCWGWGMFGELGYGVTTSIGDNVTRLPERFGFVRVEPLRQDPWLVDDASSELALTYYRDGLVCV